MSSVALTLAQGALLISAIALIVSVLVGWAGSSLQHRVVRIEEDRRQEEIDSTQRAWVNARFMKRPQERFSTSVIVLTNDGAAPAREVNLDVTVDDPKAVSGDLPIPFWPRAGTTRSPSRLHTARRTLCQSMSVGRTTSVTINTIRH